MKNDRNNGANSTEPISQEPMTPAMKDTADMDDIMRSFSTLFSETSKTFNTDSAPAVDADASDSEFDLLKKQFKQMDEEAERHKLGEHEISGIRSALDSEKAPDAEIPKVWETEEAISHIPNEPVYEELRPEPEKPMNFVPQDSYVPVKQEPQPESEKPTATAPQSEKQDKVEPQIYIPADLSEDEPRLSVDDFLKLQSRIDEDSKRKEQEDEKRFSATPEFSEAMKEVPVVSTDRAISYGAEVSTKMNEYRPVRAKVLLARLLAALVAAVIVCIFGIGAIGYCIFRGPSILYRNKMVFQAQNSAVTRWIPNVFLDDKTVDSILESYEVQNGGVN